MVLTLTSRASDKEQAMSLKDQPKFEMVANKELLIHWRDEQQRSWASVAAEVGLGSPGAARRLYSSLVRPHTESVLVVRATSKVEPLQLEGLAVEAVRKAIAGRSVIVERKTGNEEIAVAKVTSVKDGTINFHDGDKALLPAQAIEK